MDRLDRLEARVEALAAENASLRRQLAASDQPAPVPWPVDGDVADRSVADVRAAEAVVPPGGARVPRRQALRAGLAAVAGAAAGAVLLDGSPAAAEDDPTSVYRADPTGQQVGLVVRATPATGGRGVDVDTPGHGVISRSDSIALGGASRNMYGLAASGARAAIWLPLDEPRQAPTLDARSHLAGELVRDTGSDLWWSVEDGTPGRWVKLGGPGTAGALHVLDAPARAVDTRRAGGPPLAAGSSRVVDLTIGTGVPPTANAVVVNLLIVDAAPGNGHGTIWANGASRPTGNTLVWGGSAGRAATMALTRVDGAGRCRVSTSVRAHVVVDVVGYHR